jgi:cytochrome b involved in lipid metabolism
LPRRYQYDPTKVFIYCLSLVGLAYNLKQFPQNEIDKGMLQMRQRELNALKRGADWGPDPAALPYMSRKEFAALTGDGGRGVRSRELVILDGFVLDVARFAPTHPGGPQILRSKIGKDVSLDFSQHERPVAEGDDEALRRPASAASAEAKAAKAKADAAGASAAAAAPAFVIGTYKHSNAARSLSETYRIARIDGYVLPRNSAAASMASAVTGGFALADAKKHAA